MTVDQGVFATECAVEKRPSRKDVFGRHHQSRAKLGPMPTCVVRMVAEFSWGVAGGEGWPLFDVFADVELGAGVGAGP